MELSLLLVPGRIEFLPNISLRESTSSPHLLPRWKTQEWLYGLLKWRLKASGSHFKVSQSNIGLTAPWLENKTVVPSCTDLLRMALSNVTAPWSSYRIHHRELWLFCLSLMPFYKQTSILFKASYSVGMKMASCTQLDHRLLVQMPDFDFYILSWSRKIWVMGDLFLVWFRNSSFFLLHAYQKMSSGRLSAFYNVPCHNNYMGYSIYLSMHLLCQLR